MKLVYVRLAEADLEYISKFHVEVAQMPMPNSFCTTFSLLAYTHLCPHGQFPHNKSSKRERKLCPCSLLVLYDIASASHKWTAISLQSFSRIPLKDSEEKKSSIGQNFMQCT